MTKGGDLAIQRFCDLVVKLSAFNHQIAQLWAKPCIQRRWVPNRQESQ